MQVEQKAQNSVAETWRQVWGDGRVFRGPRFLKNFHSRPGFSDFLFLFPDFTMLNVVYDPFLTRKTRFLLCSYFCAHPTTLLLQILEGMGRPPPQICLGGTVPPSLP